MLVDQYEREQALDVNRSFCVSAPAGSGKTELLTQRYLHLLLTVDEPEQVLAVTFTRKARAEMTERIMRALQLGAGPKPEQAYLQITWAAAKAALAQDERKGWNLTRNPSRLRIQTIDSLNQAIAGESPLLNGFGSAPSAVDDANSLYLQTIPRLLSGLDDVDSDLAHALQQVLLVFNGDIDRFADLLCKLLAKRDQWLQYVSVAGDNRLIESLLNDSFDAWLQADMDNALALLEDFQVELIERLSFAVNNGADEALAPIEQSCELPSAELSNVTLWQALAGWLLTSTGSVRKTVNAKQGFPPKSATKNSELKQQYEHEKQQMLVLFERLKASPDTVTALQTLRLMPSALSEQQLATAKHILLVLKYAVANLSLIFAETGQCDHIQIALSAANLLGNDDMPSATQLRWNQRLRHILIDEFQDTSFIQHTILQRLVALWPEAREHNPEQLRSLFIVGDGMQSIYRFRAANVGLFIQAKQDGIGEEPLQALTLRQNFRSEKSLVEWFNNHFSASFPNHSDAAVGAVPYSQAEPSGDGSGHVSVEAFANADDEAAFIAEQTKQCLAGQSSTTIAILVRARSHLSPIMKALFEQSVSYQSNDIKYLKSIPEVIDIISLTKWIIDEYDSVSLAAILRAPWCGASLEELYQLCNSSIGTGLHFQPLLQSPEQIPARLAPTVSLLASVWQQRQRKPLADTVKGLWLALGGQYCAGGNRPYIDQYLQCLRDNSDIQCTDSLERALTTMFAKPVVSNARVSLMTIHKSKGLEFDTVFLPGLGKATKADSANLLEYAERLHEHQQHSFLLAPWGKSADDQKLRAYVKNLDKQASRHEMLRVLYVAATRASSRLVMSFVYKADEKAGEGEIKPPAKNSLLSYIWPSVTEECCIHAGEALPAASLLSLGTAKRIETMPKAIANIEALPTNELTANDNQDTAETALGTLLHQLLEQLALNKGRASTHLRNYCAAQIEFSPHIHDKAAANASVSKLIEHITQTQLGQWVITAGEQAQNEWAITACNTDNSISRYVIDRSFIDNQTRWIIDYKTSTPKAGQSLDDFLSQQAEVYRRQLAQYAYAVSHLRSHKLSHNSIKTALYFPLINELYEVKMQRQNP